MSDRRISTERHALENLLAEILTRLDRLDGGATYAGWPSFPERITLGDGALVVRHTIDDDPTRPPDELVLKLVNTVPGPPWTSAVIIATVP